MLQRLSLVSFCISLFLFSCSNNTAADKNTLHKNGPAESVDHLSALIKDGDIILRSGNDGISELFKRLNTKNQQYSHCGVALVEGGKVSVVHIIGGAENESGQIRKESLSTFINPVSNSGWAIVRYDLDSNQIVLLKEKLIQFAAQKINFDTEFDLASDDKMYCTELVFKALIFARNDTGYVGKTIGYSGKTYIAVDNLFGHKHCKTIGETAY